MQKIGIRLVDFKCYRDSVFSLNNITLLTGANAAGKSSLIQSLLLVNAALESIKSGGDYNDVDLMDTERSLDLGSVDNLINENGSDESHFIIDGSDLFFTGGDEVPSGKARIHYTYSDSLANSCFRQISYLNAERVGPRYESEWIKEALCDCGCHGERTSSVIMNNQFSKVRPDRTVSSDVDLNFRIALNEWIGYLFPGITVSVKAAGTTKCQIFVNNADLSNDNIATNVGFGISYVLPIVATCLIAKENGVIVIENPEAHLHAKAQSSMGFFLGKMAASGLRIVVETHSEHIVNGLRRAVVGRIGIKPDDVTIYFMDILDGAVRNIEISMDSQGNLSSFPVDFFDQQRQDSKAIFDVIYKR